MIKRVAEVINLVDGTEDIGVVTAMVDSFSRDTDNPADAVQLVVAYRDSFMNIDATRIEIFTVH